MPDQLLSLKIVIEKPVSGILYGLQKGSGNNYEILQAQLSDSSDLLFNLSLPIRKNKEGHLALHGPMIQGPPTARFVYLGMGNYAGQQNAPFSGRMKVPLPEITDDIAQAVQDGIVLSTTVPGTKGKDGSPNTGTVKPFNGWQLEKT